MAIHLAKVKVTYNKPIYIGSAVLDISKSIIYDFYYNHLKSVYGERCKLLYTDTDSLIINVETANFYEDMKAHIDKFDTSNYTPNNIHNMPITTSVVGKMKDEFKGKIVDKFIGTGAKAYYVKLDDDDDEDVKRAKGISGNVTAKTLHMTDYEHAVDGVNVKIFRQYYNFESNLHEIYTKYKNKVALSSDDDKRYLLENYQSLAWGHKDIPSLF